MSKPLRHFFQIDFILLLIFVGLCVLFRPCGDGHGEPNTASSVAPLTCSSSPRLVPVSKGLQAAHHPSARQASTDPILPSFSRSCIGASHFAGHHDENGEGVLALRLVLKTLQTKSQSLPRLWYLLGGTRHHVCSSCTRSQSSTEAATMGRGGCDHMESMDDTVVSPATSSAATQISQTQSEQRTQRQRQNQSSTCSQRTTVWPCCAWHSTSCTTLATSSCDCKHCCWNSTSRCASCLWGRSAAGIFERDEKDPGHACGCTCHHAEVCQEAALRYHQNYAPVRDGPERSSGRIGSSPACSPSPAWILENFSWRSSGNVAGVHRGLQTTRSCSSGAYRGGSAKPQLCQGGIRGLSPVSYRPVQERPAIDRERRSSNGYRAGGRSHSCSASARSGSDARPPHYFEEQCRGHGCRLQHFRQATSPERTRGFDGRGGRWYSLWARTIGAFWLGPQVTSASLSPCVGHVVPEMSHAAFLAWTIQFWTSLRSPRFGRHHFVLCACHLTLAPCNPGTMMLLSALLHALLWEAADR